MKKTVFFIMSIVLPKLIIYSQDIEKIRPLSIGDTLPNITINQVFNNPESEIPLADYKGKVIILDFWEYYCGSCIEALPKLQQLKEFFGDKLAIVTITKFSSKAAILKMVTPYFKKVEDKYHLPSFTLPTAVHDSTLYRYFPFKFMSHIVWISPTGKVVAFTGTERVIKENIQRVFSGEPIKDFQKVKKDIIVFNYNQPLLNFSSSMITTTQPLYYSALTKVLAGLDGKIGIDSTALTITYNLFNFPLIDLCKISVDGNFINSNSFKDIIASVHSLRLFSSNNGTPESYYFTSADTSREIYSYSITLPLNKTLQERRTILAEDLSRWLRVTKNLKIERKDILTTSLQLSPKVRTAGQPSIQSGIGKNNTRVLSLVYFLNNRFRKDPSVPLIIAEPSAFPENYISQKLPLDNLPDLSLNEVKKMLSDHHLNLKEVQAIRPMYIITEEPFK